MRLGLAVTTGHPQAPMLEHDPEKWTPVFRKDHAQIKEIERDDDSKKRHHALAAGVPQTGFHPTLHGVVFDILCPGATERVFGSRRGLGACLP
jgi:hypothetical protein